ncbi:MAG: hypothetical protein RL091_3217 [Verrucomicrobiota bacterium]|jgi:uncharacterized protein YeaO (DUF488 family)
MKPRVASLQLQEYRYGQADLRNGLRIGVARHLPRGIRRDDYAARGFFDVWLPLLAPSRTLVTSFRQDRITHRQFVQKYRAEMRRPEPRQAIRLLAAMARRQPLQVGCFCTDPNRCHRTVLKSLIEDSVGDLPRPDSKAGEFFSPACSMPDIMD